MSNDARRFSRIVHDHKGNAVVGWLDAPADRKPDRPRFEIEGARIPEIERKRAPGQRTDLRRLSAWIKMMRSLEEAKKNRDDE